MVKQVLTFARGVEGERVQLQTRHLLRDVAKMVGETFPKTIQFRSQIPESLWVVNGEHWQRTRRTGSCSIASFTCSSVTR